MLEMEIRENNFRPTKHNLLTMKIMFLDREVNEIIEKIDCVK